MMRRKILFPIGAKLIILFSLLLGIVALATITIATRVFIENNTALVQQMSMETATHLALRQRKILEGYQAKCLAWARYFFREIPTAAPHSWDWRAEGALTGFLLLEMKEGMAPVIRNRVISPKLSSLGDPTGERTYQSIAENAELAFARVEKGENRFARIAFGQGLLALGAPFMSDERTKTKWIFYGIFEEQEFLEAMKEGEAISSFLVNSRGELLGGAGPLNPQQHPLVQKFTSGDSENYQTVYSDLKTGEKRIGAFQSIGFSGLAMVSEVSEMRALEIVHRVRYRAGLVAGLVLSAAFLFTYFFSKSLTSPIETLMRATMRIQEGNFEVRVRTRGRDEVALLGRAFNQMAAGLQERERVKEVFARFHNQQIADKMLSGELKLGGEKKKAVVFFSDLRDFTKLSEALEPEKVVEMVNEYFTRMVSVIHRHGGVVDKYVGDAIVAFWGIPLESETAATDALSACLEMRSELKQLNEIRIKRGQEILRMGMGLHTGAVIVGNIGSEQRMEYTAIGDTMNLASRIQSLTKETGVDLLVSESVVAAVGTEFGFESKGSFSIRGKSQEVVLYTVPGETLGTRAA